MAADIVKTIDIHLLTKQSNGVLFNTAPDYVV